MPRCGSERGIWALTRLRAGLLGQRHGPIGRDPQTLRILFDLLARNARGGEVPLGTTIQWDFSDAEPWYALVARGRLRPSGDPRILLRMQRLFA